MDLRSEPGLVPRLFGESFSFGRVEVLQNFWWAISDQQSPATIIKILSIAVLFSPCARVGIRPSTAVSCGARTTASKG